jgi:hypothetical protein
MITSSRYRAGLALLATTGLLDMASLFAIGDSDSPKPVIAITVALGLIALAGVGYGWRGSRAGLLAAVISRVIDVALGVPAYFLGAPGWVIAVITTGIVLTVLAIGLVTPQLRRSKAQLAGS